MIFVMLQIIAKQRILPSTPERIRTSDLLLRRQSNPLRAAGKTWYQAEAPTRLRYDAIPASISLRR